MGLIVKTKARHHAIATKFSRPFTFDGKPLIAQYVSVSAPINSFSKCKFIKLPWLFETK